MRMPQSQFLSFKQRKGLRLGNHRTRKKHKRLDAICDKVYNHNREFQVDSTMGNGAAGSESLEPEPRRSLRPRRPPAVFDASPRPSKNLRKVGMNQEIFNNHVDSTSKGYHSPEVISGVNELDNWKTRLRSSVKDVSLREKTLDSRHGKRKFFGDLETVKDEPILKRRALEGGKGVMHPRTSAITCSRMPRRIKATNVSLQDKKELMLFDTFRDQGGGKGGVVEITETKGDEDPVVLENVICGGNESEVDGNIKQLDFKEDGEARTDVVLECIDDCNFQNIGNTNKEPADLESAKKGAKECVSVEVIGCNPKKLEAGGSCDSRSASNVELEKRPEEDGKVCKMEATIHDFVERLSKSQLKEGRRCGLCGGANDGKPPKRVVEEIGESEKEPHSDSASNEHSYNILDEFGDDPGWLGRILGPLNDRFGIAGTWVHQYCAVWSPEVYFSGLGCLKNIRAALCRGRGLKCTRCDRPGATIGCRVDRCPKTYHLPCARANGCHFDQRKFLIACTDHRNIFQPHGNQYRDRIKKLKLRKLKLELKKAANESGRKDLEAEEKWLDNCGVDGEFLKRESKRLQRDILRIAPVYIGGSSKDSGTEQSFQGWESVAGLQNVVQSLKEVVILPLLYPEFFDKHGLTPPRGVLLHGYPGTGKTLVVRALIGSCALGDKRIAYFARKGADCLGKYVGDAERQLRLLFQVAEKSQPSIIFFDEIDGLAPCRTRQQDQTHNSVVSTLLALLDGLKSRGSVVVIGATNRPEAVDPALRRPGRFDREIYFPLPSVNDRAAILSLHTKSWPKPVSGTFLKWIATKTPGFAGADLQALCTQAAMIALKRNCPLQQILNSAEKRGLNIKRRPLPSFLVEERDWLVAIECSPLPCSRREIGMSTNDVVSTPLHAHLLPCLLQPLSVLLVSLFLDECVCLAPHLSKAAGVVKELIFSLLEERKLDEICWWSHVPDMLREADIAKDIEKCLFFLTGQANSCVSDPLNSNTNMALLPLMKKSGFRILIAGNPKSGQRHVASFLFHYLFGDFEIHKIDLTTISQEGRGDNVRGITRILMSCASTQTSVVFMPRVDLWAVQLEVDVDQGDSCSSDPHLSTGKNTSKSEHCQVSRRDKKVCGVMSKLTDTTYCDVPALIASHSWNIFIQQIESMCLSTSLIVLATSDVPYQQLPPRVTQFFKSGMLCTPETFSKNAAPPFVLQIDGNFNHHMVINSSAAQLSKDIVQFFIQLLHHASHNVIAESREEEYNECDIIDGDTNQNHMIRENPPVKNPVLLCNNRSVKEKSSFSAIVTFGYQILQYPQFAELCWVTSKLKDGPCAEAKGPWRNWPFNACIVRPANEKCNLKNKEKSFSLVRGLIAVGLVASKGGFASLSEVSSEVQKVLDLLVGQINEKIKSGKDRCQFIRILSQAAYLKDMVHSWAYTLQCLEAVPNSTQVYHDAHNHRGEGSKTCDGGSPVEKPNVGEKVDADCSLKGQDVTILESESVHISNGTVRNHSENADFSSADKKGTRVSSDSAVVCSYNCCNGCICRLHSLMKEILIHAKERNGKDWTVDGVHDIVTTLSSKLISEVRKHHLIKGFNTCIHGKSNRVMGHQKEDGCECNKSRNPHHALRGDSEFRLENASRFLFRNGILVVESPVDEGIPFHCEFETLCLCSLVEWLSKKKKKLSNSGVA